MYNFEELLETHKSEQTIETRYYDRILHYFRQWAKPNRNESGIEQLFFALYASIPLVLTPDFLHKLRFNFKNFEYLQQSRRIPAVAVNDLMLSALCKKRESFFYEIPYPIRLFLTSFFHRIEQEPGLITDLRISKSIQIANFIRHYTAINAGNNNPEKVFFKALQIDAELYINPTLALAQLAEEFKKIGHDKPLEQYRLSLLTEQMLQPTALQNRMQLEEEPSKTECQVLLSYARALKSYHIQGVSSNSSNHFQGFIHYKQSASTVQSIDLPVPIPSDLLLPPDDTKEPPIGYNPYVFDRPIESKSLFFGRNDIVQIIETGIHQNGFIIDGEPKIGKTSLLHKLANSFAKKSGTSQYYYASIIDLANTNGDQFWQKLSSAFTGEASKNQNYLNYHSFKEAIDQFTNFLERSNSGKAIQIVILLDNVQVLNEYKSEIQAQFRRFLQEDTRYRVVMSGHIQELNHDSISSPWHNTLLFLKLGPLSDLEARQLISAPVKTRYLYSVEATQLILSKSKRKPQLIQMLCFYAINHMLERVSEDTNDNQFVIEVADVEKAATLIQSVKPKIAKKLTYRNPYIVGPVIRDDFNFYGRQSLVEELAQLTPATYFIKGNRRVGKTSLLRKLDRILLKNTKAFHVYFNIEGASSLEDFAEYFNRALENSSRQKGIEIKKHSDLHQAFLQSVEQCRHLGLHCFILIDEAEMLFYLSENGYLNKFYSELTTAHENLTVIMCATNRFQNINVDVSSDVLFDKLTVKHIGCLSINEAEDLIRQSNAPEFKVHVDNKILKDILKHTGTHPFLIQRTCYNLFDKGKLRKLRKSDLVLDINLRSFFEIDFRSLTPLHQQILLQFFWERPLKAKDFSGQSAAIIQEALNELEQLGFLSKNDGAYSLGNYFLAQWLDEKRAEGFTHEDIPETKRTGSKKLNVFISYAQEDAAYMVALNKHLSVLKRSKKVATWSEYNILPGTDWDREIHQQIVNADLVLLLVSASFLSSDSIWNEQINIVMERHSQGESRVVPILIRDCVWEETPFGNIQGLPRSNNPVGSTRNDNAWAEIVTELKALVDELSLH